LVSVPRASGAPAPLDIPSVLTALGQLRPALCLYWRVRNFCLFYELNPTLTISAAPAVTLETTYRPSRFSTGFRTLIDSISPTPVSHGSISRTRRIIQSPPLMSLRHFAQEQVYGLTEGLALWHLARITLHHGCCKTIHGNLLHTRLLVNVPLPIPCQLPVTTPVLIFQSMSTMARAISFILTSQFFARGALISSYRK
jgi:hypothetical protein